ncbi:MAG: nucleotidyltransferase family protein [Novosphingobium sp.]
MVGTGSVDGLDQLSDADWSKLNTLAAQHRLRPLLHAQHGNDLRIPAEIRTDWQEAHRLAALQAMLHRHELTECVQVLEGVGIVPIALKGAWLAAHAYPAPALRPMRDIDLLVPQGRVLEGYAALKAASYIEYGPAEMSLEQALRLDKHLPPLIARHGTVIELHHRLWEPDGRLDHASPAAPETAQAKTWRDDDGITYLDPAATLAHLIVHAVYSHRLDCGPLLLPDIDWLLRAEPIDWEAFWDRARREGWRSGARLVLELVRTYRNGAPIAFAPDDGPPPPAGLIEAAPDLLLQDLDTRRSAGFAAAAIKAGPAKLFQRLRGRRGAKGEDEVTREMAHDGGMLGWAGSRAWRSLTELARPDVRRQSRQLAALSTWLDR